MRRQDIRLLAAVRQGDVAARCEVGRRYLSGESGFPRHVQTGMDYLNHASVRSLPEVAQITAECLPLEQLLSLGRERDLQVAATRGSLPGLLKLGVWQIMRGRSEAGLRTLKIAIDAGSATARDAIKSLGAESEIEQLRGLLRTAGSRGYLDPGLVALASVRSALDCKDAPCLSTCLSLAMSLIPESDRDLADLTLRAVRLAAESGEQLNVSPVRGVQLRLEVLSSQGSVDAAFILGCALCGMFVGHLSPQSLVTTSNLRRASALLLQSADGGCREAWLLLYRLHFNKRSFANVEMARFFLEKAAAAEITEAKRILGTRILTEARGISQSERGIQLLFDAASRGDNLAARLLCSLVLPVRGLDVDASLAIAEVTRRSPWLGARLQLARDFGLTRLEALTVNPAEGARSWGLVVGPNPFISQSRMSAPRAIPALSGDILARLDRAAAQFGIVRDDNCCAEGDLQQRSRTMRSTFECLQLDESTFFADASSEVLDTLRLGNRWAIRVKELLSAALGDLEGRSVHIGAPSPPCRFGDILSSKSGTDRPHQVERNPQRVSSSAWD